jgi:hypothetical protein
VKIANRSFANVISLRYLGLKVTDQHFILIREEIKRRFNLVSVCYHSVLSSSLLPKNIQIKRNSHSFACGFVWM